MKIIQVIPDLKQASGPTAFCVKICDQMADRPHTAVSIMHGGTIDATSCVPKNPLVRVFYNWADVWRDMKPDVLHVHSLWSLFSHEGVRNARQHKTPYVISAHGMLAPWALKHKCLKKKIAWWLYQKNDLSGTAMFHVTAECEIRWLRDLGFKQPCVLAPLGSDLSELTYNKEHGQKDVRTVLFVGRINPVKGLMNLVRAWARLKKSANSESVSVNVNAERSSKTACDSRLMANGIPWRLIIAGPDQAGHKAELVAEAKRLGLGVEDVTASQLISKPANQPARHDLLFTGAVYGEEKDALYRMADLFVLPSFTENFGVVVTDALAYEIPVITTKATPWAELQENTACIAQGHDSHHSEFVGAEGFSTNRKVAVSNDNAIVESSVFATSAPSPVPAKRTVATSGRCGWWIDIGAEPLVAALKESMSLSDEERYAMGCRGRALVESKYTWPAVSEKMHAAYAWLVDGGGRPDCVFTE